MKIKLLISAICIMFSISGCTTVTSTPDLNMNHLRVVNITKYDTAIIATFCGSEKSKQLFSKEPYPMVYPVLKESESYLSFKKGFISKYDIEKYKAWLGDANINKFPEYEECGKERKYPYIYWFKFNLEKTPPSKKSNRESYIRAYNEFKQQIIDTHQIELGVVQLPGLAGKALVSEETSFLKLDDEQYALITKELK